jgi:hypothetical protein
VRTIVVNDRHGKPRELRIGDRVRCDVMNKDDFSSIATIRAFVPSALSPSQGTSYASGYGVLIEWEPCPHCGRTPQRQSVAVDSTWVTPLEGGTAP